MDPLWFLVVGVLPYVSVAVLVGGIAYRFIEWMRIPTPLKIPTTPAPKSLAGVTARVASEVFLFRSLFRGSKKLWVGSLAYHATLWTILLYKLLTYLPPLLAGLTGGLIDFTLTPYLRTVAVYQAVGYVGLFLSGSILFLLSRRLILPSLRYLSRFTDYLPLILIASISLTGTYLRAYTQISVDEVVALVKSLAAFRPPTPPAEPFFLIHFLFIQVLMMYFPFSKLMHVVGVLLSPTRNQRDNPRARRHVNPWDYPVEIENWQDYARRYGIEGRSGDEGGD